MTMKLLLGSSVFLVLVVWATSVRAATTYTVTNCTSTNVQSAVNTAVRGDSIYLNCSSSPVTWSSAVVVKNKGLTIYGNGPTATVINASDTTLFAITLSNLDDFRIHDLGFTGTGGSYPGGLESQYILLNGNTGGTIWKSFRADHLRFTDINTHAFTIDPWWQIPYHPKALFDHITLSSSRWSRLLKIAGNNLTWREPDQYGTDYAIFIEDSTFTWTNNANGDVTDTEHGVRLVVRNNTITGGDIQMHDTGSTPAARGQRVTEIYNNVINSAGSTQTAPMGLRGGGYLVYNNTLIGYSMPAYPQIWRATVGSGYLGSTCNGTPVRACNTPTLMHCSGGAHAACAVDSDCTGTSSGSCVVACTGDSQCPIGTDGTATCLATLDNVDGGLDPSGYPCRDQTGTGQEYSQGGRLQYPSPVYWWNNQDGFGRTLDLSYTSSYFELNRDYCRHDPSTSCGLKPAWTYTGYTYPHPWQTQGSQGSAASAPTNLQLN
jgi:hypothetical protein